MPIIIIFISLITLAGPMLHLLFINQLDMNYVNIIKSKNSDDTTKVSTINFDETEIDIPRSKNMQVQSIQQKNSFKYKISGGKLKKNIVISKLNKPLSSWNYNIANANPLAFLVYPVHALKNINMPIPPGNATKFQEERIDMIYKIINLNLANLLPKALSIGPFLIGTYFFSKEVQENINILESPINAYWIKNNSISILLIGKKNALLVFPVDSKKTDD